MSDDDGAWFAPKRYGYGAGLPIRWQGWAVLAAFLVVIAVAEMALAARHWLVFAVIFTVDVAALLWVTARHTRGGWRWRWRWRSGDER